MGRLTNDYVFHRDFNKTYPLITHGEGVYLFDADGKRYLDASSGAVAANLGHGITEIADAMARQAQKVGFVHTVRFETEVMHDLAEKIAQLAPDPLNYVYFASGGSEANESAIKLARQIHRDRGDMDKHLAIGRWQNYHGNTLGSLSIGGDIKRRKPYTPILKHYPHLYTPDCRQFHDKDETEYALQCADELERLINEYGSENISCFLLEPIVGSQQGAMVPPKGYLKRVREICDQYNVILIADEVMTGFGRTGKDFAVEHFDFIPDIITFGKGVSAGYAPLSGMIVSDRLVESLITHSKGVFTHGYTYSGHPVSVAAGLAALQYYEEKNVRENCVRQGEYLKQQLLNVREKHATVGDIRGKGLLIGIDLLPDRHSSQQFPPSFAASEKLNQICMENGAVFYPGSGGIDGVNGEHLLIAPPLTIQQQEVDELIAILDQALTIFEQMIEKS